MSNIARGSRQNSDHFLDRTQSSRQKGEREREIHKKTSISQRTENLEIELAEVRESEREKEKRGEKKPDQEPNVSWQTMEQ